MNDYFRSIGIKMKHKIINFTSVLTFSPTSSPSSIFLEPCSWIEILNIIHGLKFKTGDIEGMATKALKIFYPHVADILINLMIPLKKGFGQLYSKQLKWFQSNQ